MEKSWVICSRNVGEFVQGKSANLLWEVSENCSREKVGISSALEVVTLFRVFQ